MLKIHDFFRLCLPVHHPSIHHPSITHPSPIHPSIQVGPEAWYPGGEFPGLSTQSFFSGIPGLGTEDFFFFLCLFLSFYFSLFHPPRPPPPRSPPPPLISRDTSSRQWPDYSFFSFSFDVYFSSLKK